MPLKVGLYFGSFNPIHKGHVALAQYLIDQYIVDEVWFILSPNNPLKEKTELLDHHIRYDMVKLAIQHNPKFKVSDIEFSLPYPSYTIHTLRLFSKLYPDDQFYLLIGSDNAVIFDKWKDYQEILNKYNVLVYPRDGYDFQEFEGNYPQMTLLDSPLYNISSTKIREDIKNNKLYSGELPESVYKYIQENNLYK